jgi:hypothetical protein
MRVHRHSRRSPGKPEAIEGGILVSDSVWHENRFMKFLALGQVSFVLLALAVIILTPPATGYELSIYDAYPTAFWLSIFASIFIGILLIVQSGIKGRGESLYWLFGLFSLLLLYVIILSLPLIRGYVLYGRGNGDILSHIGWMKAIAYSGHISGTDYYPVVHILGSIFNFTGMSFESVAFFMLTLFSLTYFLFVLLLAKTVSSERGQMLFVVAFASPLLFSSFHESIHPSILSAFMIPVLLAVYHRKGTFHSAIEYSLIAVILLLTFVFFHPFTAIIVAIILVVFGFVNYFTRSFAPGLGPEPKVAYLLVTLVVGLYVWLNPFSGISSKMGAVLAALFDTSETSMVSHYGDLLEQASLPISQVIDLFLNQYGYLALYLAASLIALFFVLRSYLKHEAGKFEFYYAFQFVAASAFTLIMVFGYFIEFEPLRIARYIIVVVPVLCGLAFYQRFRSMSAGTGRKALAAFMILLIVSASILAIQGLFFSPKIVKANAQLTAMEADGTGWYLGSTEGRIPLLATDLKLVRYEAYYYGFDTPGYRGRPQLDTYIPSHFGYDTNTTFARSMNNRTAYMITTEANRLGALVFPETVRPLVHQYLAEDFIRLSHDPSVTKSYTNGECEVWLVTPPR